MKNRAKIQPVRMKISAVLILMMLACIMIDASAQITITQADMPVPNNAVRTSSALNTNLYDFEETGENYIWDYQDLQFISQAVDTFVRVTDTPITYWPFFILSANLAKPVLEDSPLPELPLSDVYNFYNSSSNNYRDVGFAAMISGIPLPFAFDEHDILYKFPMNYGNVDSSESGYSFGLPDVAFILVDRKRVNTVDGWGSLTTPYGTFDVLRLKSEVTEYDSIYIDSLDIGLPINREYIEYKWMANGQKAPLLSVTDDFLTLVVNYIDSLRVDVVDVPEFDTPEINEAIVYPNPNVGSIKVQLPITYSGLVEIYLYDFSGKPIKSYRETAFANQTFQKTIDLQKLGLEAGEYLIRIRDGKKQYVNKLIYQAK